MENVYVPRVSAIRDLSPVLPLVSSGFAWFRVSRGPDVDQTLYRDGAAGARHGSYETDTALLPIAYCCPWSLVSNRDA
jgi:hypothetical protein